MKQRLSLICIAGIVFSMTIGCSLKGNKSPWQPIKNKKPSVVHLVQYQEETLPLIAKWYTGDIDNLESLSNANPNINPDHLFLGNEIFIPEHLVKTRESMPEDFVSTFYQKPEKKTPSQSAKIQKKKAPGEKKSVPLPKAEEEDEFEIFGPK